MFHDPTFWVALAFFIFIGLVWKPVARIVARSLDERGKSIEDELAEAVRLREEAQQLLASYQKKGAEVEAEAEALLKAAREEAIALQRQAEEQLKAALEARVALADKKIAQEEERAIEEVKRQVVELAMQAARETITTRLQDESDDKLIQLALKDIQRIVH